ncbi:MAG: ribonuclease HI [Tannerellaceae bacterium]|nr:ribonuclease HI [Tannerellaceae bacterium]
MEQNQQIPVVDLFSDGGADPNPGKGGYGVILSYKGVRKEFCQGFKETTNNRMELLGVITGLEKLNRRAIVNVYTDSQYVVNGIEQGWAKKWKQNNWYRTKKEKAINRDLWERLLELLTKHEVHFHWVKGHNGHAENERCDALATQAINQEELLEDKGYQLQEEIKAENTIASRRVLKEGDLCTKCNTPVIKKPSKKRTVKPGQTHYFEYFLSCPACHHSYMVEEAKRPIEEFKPPQLF